MKLVKNMLLLVVVGLLVSCSPKDVDTGGKLKVYSSVYPVWDFTSKVGGDRIDNKMLVPMGAEAHDWEPSPTDIADLEKADVLVINGLGLEQWFESVSASLSNKDLLIIDASKDTTPMEGHSHSHDEHDHEHDEDEHEHEHDDHEEEHDEHEHDEHDDHDHGIYDPHIWSSPVEAKKQMKIIMEELSKADPDNAAYYKENYDKYALEFDKLDEEYRTAVSEFSSTDMVVSHEAYGYLAHEYGLNQVGIEGLVPESEPTPQRMAEIIDLVKEKNVKAIFFEEAGGSKVADSIESSTGAKAIYLSTLESLNQKESESGADYFSVMRSNLEALKEGLR